MIQLEIKLSQQGTWTQNWVSCQKRPWQQNWKDTEPREIRTRCRSSAKFVPRMWVLCSEQLQLHQHFRIQGNPFYQWWKRQCWEWIFVSLRLYLFHWQFIPDERPAENEYSSLFCGCLYLFHWRFIPDGSVEVPEHLDSVCHVEVRREVSRPAQNLVVDLAEKVLHRVTVNNSHRLARRHHLEGQEVALFTLIRKNTFFISAWNLRFCGCVRARTCLEEVRIKVYKGKVTKNVFLGLFCWFFCTILKTKERKVYTMCSPLDGPEKIVANENRRGKISCFRCVWKSRHAFSPDYFENIVKKDQLHHRHLMSQSRCQQIYTLCYRCWNHPTPRAQRSFESYLSGANFFRGKLHNTFFKPRLHQASLLLGLVSGAHHLCCRKMTFHVRWSTWALDSREKVSVPVPKLSSFQNDEYSAKRSLCLKKDLYPWKDTTAASVQGWKQSNWNAGANYPQLCYLSPGLLLVRTSITPGLFVRFYYLCCWNSIRLYICSIYIQWDWSNMMFLVLRAVDTAPWLA